MAVSTIPSLAAGSVFAAQAPGSKRDDDALHEVSAVEAQARAAGLGPLRHARSRHFLSVGDAPDGYQRDALAICESLGEAFLAHFRGRGFTLDYPERPLTMIVLKDRLSYAAFQGKEPGKFEGGHFDLDTNRLVVFDFRSQRDEIGESAERVNMFTLVHETAHQLSFNCGMLSRAAQPPVSISEGLATYVELWRPKAKSAIGAVNRARLEALREATDWISVGDLLADDRAFEARTEQLAYAESWVLVHSLLGARGRQARFREYLQALRGARQPGDRIPIAEKTLGALTRMDRDLKDDVRKYLRLLSG